MFVLLVSELKAAFGTMLNHALLVVIKGDLSIFFYYSKNLTKSIEQRKYIEKYLFLKILNH